MFDRRRAASGSLLISDVAGSVCPSTLCLWWRTLAASPSLPDHRSLHVTIYRATSVCAIANTLALTILLLQHHGRPSSSPHVVRKLQHCRPSDSGAVKAWQDQWSMSSGIGHDEIWKPWTRTAANGDDCIMGTIRHCHDRGASSIGPAVSFFVYFEVRRAGTQAYSRPRPYPGNVMVTPL